MKRNRLKLRYIVLIAIGGYVVLFAIGLFVMIFFSIDNHRSEIVRNPIEVKSADIPDSLPEDFLDAGGAEILVYDIKGNVLISEFNINRVSLKDRVSSKCERALSVIAQGKCYFNISIMYNEQISAYMINYIYGAPIICNGQVIGGAFHSHSPAYFARTLMIFVILFTVFYSITAVAVIAAFKKMYIYEDARANYIANVTHNLKTPVTAIKALAETIRFGADMDNEEMNECCDMIIEQADVQAKMVQNMLSLARIQSNRSKIKKKPANAIELIIDPVKKHKTQCARKNITLNVSDDIYKIPMLYTNEEIVRQVMDAVLDNAVKYTNNGGRINVSADYSGKQAIISVEDNGIGIEKKHLPYVFERFYTANSLTSDTSSGLGLAIGKELIEGLGEKIWVTSEIGVGTTVSFSVALK